MTWAHQLPIAFDIFTSLRTIDSSRSCLIVKERQDSHQSSSKLTFHDRTIIGRNKSLKIIVLMAKINKIFTTLSTLIKHFIKYVLVKLVKLVLPQDAHLSNHFVEPWLSW